MTLTAGHFTKVCEAARWNLRAALDLIAIHSEKEVRGRQPRASLNPFTVLAAVAAWERFLADAVGASAGTGKPWPGPGHFKFDPKKDNKKLPDGRWVTPPWDPSYLNDYLRVRGVIKSGLDLTDYWEAHLAGSWWGAAPTRWRYVRYADDPSAFEVALKNAQYARHGAAHFALPYNAVMSAPFGYNWNSDAAADTIQSGHARAVAALFLQLIDCSIIAIAEDHGWRPERYQPTSAWFEAMVPASDTRYPRVEFWGGRSLFRGA
jgi:hypothetical protein